MASPSSIRLDLIAFAITGFIVSGSSRTLTVECMKNSMTGDALCALDPATLNESESAGMSGVFGCTMRCTTDDNCRNFNYVSTESSPCQLYYYTPTNFSVVPNCTFYQQRGVDKDWAIDGSSDAANETTSTSETVSSSTFSMQSAAITSSLPSSPTSAPTTTECSPILMQQHVDDSAFFNRSWQEFKSGFGDPSGNFWLGNERIYELTKYGDYKLVVETERDRFSSGTLVEEEECEFSLGAELSNYTATFYCSWLLNGVVPFTTSDRDNDNWPEGNCALEDGGGYWYKRKLIIGCSGCSLNAAGDKFKCLGSSLVNTRMILTCPQHSL